MLHSHTKLFLIIAFFISFLFLLSCETTGHSKVDDKKADKIYECIKIAEENKNAEELEVALTYYENAVDMLLSMESRNRNYCGSLLYDIALLYIDLQKYQDAILYLNKAYSEIKNEKERDSYLISSIHYTTGWVYSTIEEYKKAEDYYQLAISSYLSENKIDCLGLSNTYFALAFMYRNSGNNVKAEKYYIDMLKVYEENKSDDYENMGEVLYRIAYFYMEIEEYTVANQYFLKCIETSEKCYNYILIYDSYSCIGYIYFKQNKIDKSIEFYEKTLDGILTNDPDNCNAIGKCNSDLGSIYFSSVKDYTIALKYYENAKKSYFECGNLKKTEEMEAYLKLVKSFL